MYKTQTDGGVSNVVRLPVVLDSLDVLVRGSAHKVANGGGFLVRLWAG